MQTFAIKPLGCDNGSGEFERGGSLNTNKVQVTNVLDLAGKVAGALVEQNCEGVDVRVYDATTTKLGEHYLVSFCTDEEGCGEQSFAFICTEVL